MSESKEELKSLLMRVKEKSERADLKLNIKKTKMSSSSITSWQIEEEMAETMTDFLLLGSKSLWIVTVAMKLKDDCLLAVKLRQI